MLQSKRFQHFESNKNALSVIIAPFLDNSRIFILNLHSHFLPELSFLTQFPPRALILIHDINFFPKTLNLNSQFFTQNTHSWLSKITLRSLILDLDSRRTLEANLLSQKSEIKSVESSKSVKSFKNLKRICVYIAYLIRKMIPLSFTPSPPRIFKMVNEPVIPTLQYLYFKSLYTIHKVLECNTRTYP